MKNNHQIAFLIIWAAVAFATLAFVILPPLLYGTKRHVTTPESPAPDQVVQDFYTWYISYNGNPLVDRAYQSSEILSSNFITYLDDFTQSGEGNYDPILCAQDVPAEFTAYPAQISGEQALVEVTTSFANHALAVELIELDGKWLINKVDCVQ